MKTIVYVQNKKTAGRIVELLKKYYEDVRIDIIKTSKDCYKCGSDCDYAFISETADGMPWDDLMEYFAGNGVSTYFVTDEGTSEIYDRVRKAGGKRVITENSMENDIKVLMKAARRDKTAKVPRKKTAPEEEPETQEQQAEPEPEEEKKVTKTGTGKAVKPDSEKMPKPDVELVEYEEHTASSVYDLGRLRGRKYPGVIVSIHGAKGGVGKTTICANLGVGLALLGLKTVTVDLDVENGNLASVLHITSSRTIKDWVKGNVQEEDNSLAVHESGLNVLQGIRMPVEAGLITAEVAERIIARLARRFDVVVIDTGAVEINPMLVAMQMSEKCYIIADYDLTRAPNLVNMLNDAKTLGIDLEKMKLVINLVPEKKPARQQDLMENIPIQILTEIRRDDSVTLVVNEGGVPYIDRRCRKFSEDLFVLIEDILESTEYSQKLERGFAQKKRGGLLEWLGF